MHGFSTTLEFARRLDQEDKLASFRQRFYMPAQGTYLDGNSLGLMSADAEATLHRVQNEWKEMGIDGWLSGEKPWFYLAEEVGRMAAPLVGAGNNEVIATGTTTVNIHTLLSTFYKPNGKRNKIVADVNNFPSDIYAINSHLKLRGFDPSSHLVLVPSEADGFLSENRVVDMLNEEVSILFLSAVLFKTGQLLNIERLAKETHRHGILFGVDGSHSVGAVPHQFHKDEVDFATWCGYKYLNGGPGSSAFIYIHEKHFGREPLMAGWFGYVKEKQFEMSLDFKHQPEAGGWQISTPTLLSLAPLEGSLKLFQEAGMEQLRQKSVALTTYLIQLVNEILGAHPYDFYNGSPDDPGRRGGHVAVCRDTEAWRISQALRSLGFVPDFRPPNIIRIAPVALYNSYEDVWRTIQAIKRVVDERLYENFQVEMASVS